MHGRAGSDHGGRDISDTDVFGRDFPQLVDSNNADVAERAAYDNASMEKDAPTDSEMPEIVDSDSETEDTHDGRQNKKRKDAYRRRSYENAERLRNIEKAQMSFEFVAHPGRGLAHQILQLRQLSGPVWNGLPLLMMTGRPAEVQRSRHCRGAIAETVEENHSVRLAGS